MPHQGWRTWSALLFTHSWRENNWIHTFPKSISAMWNAISPGFELVSPCPIPATITITPRAPPPFMMVNSFHSDLILCEISEWNFSTACNWFCLTCHVNALVHSVLQWCNNNNNTEITPFTSVLAGRNLHMSQTSSHQRRYAWPTNCKDAHASVLIYTSDTPHARHICAHFELWGRPFHSLFLASFFLPFTVAMKGIHSTQVCCHISFLSYIWLTTCFLSNWGRLLDSRKPRLFCLYI